MSISMYASNVVKRIADLSANYSSKIIVSKNALNAKNLVTYLVSMKRISSYFNSFSANLKSTVTYSLTTSNQIEISPSALQQPHFTSWSCTGTRIGEFAVMINYGSL